MALNYNDIKQLLDQGLTMEQIEKFGGEISPDVLKTVPKASKAKPRTLVGKVIAGGERVLGVAASPTAKRVLAPLAERLPISEEQRSALQDIEVSPDVSYGSDIAEVLAPQIFKPVPGESTLKGAGKVAARMGVDIATDPLSYVGIGMPTKLGRMLKVTKEAIEAGRTIKLDSKLAKGIAEVMGAERPSPQLIKNFIKSAKATPTRTMSQQIASGERSLFSIGKTPFGAAEIPLPLIGTGKIAGAIVKPLSLARRGFIGAKIENLAREAFSTKSGNPEFDALIAKARSQVEYRKGLKIEDAKVMQKQFNDITREMGITREELNATLNRMGEAVLPTGKKAAKGKYSKSILSGLEDSYRDGLIDAQIGLKAAHATGNAADIEHWAKQVVDYNSALNDITGKYRPPPSIDPKIDKIVNEIRERNAQQLLRDQTSGVRVTPLLADREYLPHILTPEAMESLSAKLKAEGKLPKTMSTKEFNDHLANAVRRQFVEIKPIVIKGWADAGLITKGEARAILSKSESLSKVVYDVRGMKSTKTVTAGIKRLDELLDAGKITDAQFTDAVHTLGIEEVNGLPIDKLRKIFGDTLKDGQAVFQTDPIYHTTVRGIRGEVARTAAEFFTELKGRGIALADAAAPAHWVNVRQAELAGHKVSPEIARVLNKFDTFQTNPQELRKLLRVYDRFHSLTKVWTLAPFPAYHTMNAVGNFWNNFLAGVTNPDVYRQALMTQINKVDRRWRPLKFKDVYGKEWTNETLSQTARELGVTGRGQYGAEVQHTIKQELEKGKFLTLSSRNHFLRVGNRIGKFVEDNARMAHFIDRLKKGDTPEQAAMSVKKFLFDYGDLTDMERNVLNRVFFFYTWTRKNLPLQLQHLVTTPAKFSLPYKAKHEIEQTSKAPDEKYLPDWMSENFPMRIRYDEKTKKHEYFMLNRWLPASDLTKLVHLHDIALQMVAPLGKETAQQLFNYDFYFKRQITDLTQGQLGETEKMLGMELPKRITHGMKTIRLLNEIDKLTKEDSDLLSKMVHLSSGKNYPYDADAAMRTNAYRVDEDIKKLTAAVRKEEGKSKPNQKKVDRIIALIEQKAEEY